MNAVDVVLVRLLRAALADDWRIVDAVEGLLASHGHAPLVLGAARAKLFRRPEARESQVVQRAVAALSATLEVARDGAEDEPQP